MYGQPPWAGGRRALTRNAPLCCRPRSCRAGCRRVWLDRPSRCTGTRLAGDDIGLEGITVTAHGIHTALRQQVVVLQGERATGAEGEAGEALADAAVGGGVRVQVRRAAAVRRGRPRRRARGRRGSAGAGRRRRAARRSGPARRGSRVEGELAGGDARPGRPWPGTAAARRRARVEVQGASGRGCPRGSGRDAARPPAAAWSGWPSRMVSRKPWTAGPNARSRIRSALTTLMPILTLIRSAGVSRMARAVNGSSSALPPKPRLTSSTPAEGRRPRAGQVAGGARRRWSRG